jgi:hypothetical protein
VQTNKCSRSVESLVPKKSRSAPLKLRHEKSKFRDEADSHYDFHRACHDMFSQPSFRQIGILAL